MLDHRLFSADRLAATTDHLRLRGVDAATVDDVSTVAGARLRSIAQVEQLRQRLNIESRALGALAKAGDEAALATARQALGTLKAEIKQADIDNSANEARLRELLLRLPNLADESAPQGASEADNRQDRVVGTAPWFEFSPRPHWELGESLGILDFERAAKLSGSRFVVYRGAGARLERALINFMLDLAADAGYTEIAPPLLVRPEAMQNAGQYPKFRGDAFEVGADDADGDAAMASHVLIPTSEVPLVGLHADEILEQETLPRRYSAYTPCFRREAGAAGRDTRGLIRLHQFNKVELVSLTAPEHSDDELGRMTECAERVLGELGLHYRVVSLCTGDMGFCAQRTFDLEVWLPSAKTFGEISSCSNCGDFQARRAKIRYRPATSGQKGGKKPKPAPLHTLNGSALAVGRCVVAILENYQRADGSVTVPKALRPYFGADLID